MKQITLQQFELPQADAFPAGTIKSVLENTKSTLCRWRHRSVQRRYLAGISIRLLDDIGITDAQRLEEISKPFWRK